MTAAIKNTIPHHQPNELEIQAFMAMKARVEALEAENARIKASQSAPRALGLKIGDKGGVCLTGMGRFPVTLYKEQWLRLLNHGDKIREFITANDSKLKAKGE